MPFVEGGIVEDAVDYGLRPDGTPKGNGWLGELKLPDGGVATEYSIQSEAVKKDGQMVDFPTLVPTLTPDEVSLMVNDIIPNDKQPPESIIQKAIAHANDKISKGQSPFAGGTGFVEGGKVEDLTPEDSYNLVSAYESGQLDLVPTKEEFLAYNKVKKEKPLLGERPMETVAGAAVETGKFLATLPYRAGEAISETVIAPPEGVTRGEAVAGTAAEVASQAALGFQRLTGGIEEFITQKLKNDDDKYEAFLRIADIKRKLAAAQNLVPEQRVPASQEFLQMFNIPQEAISPAGTEVGGFVSAPENIAFGVGGKVGGALLGAAARQIPRVGARLQGAGAAVGNVARMPEMLAGRAATALTGSEAAGEAVQRAVATGTTGLTAAEAFGVPVSGTLGVPGVGAASQFISGTKAAGAIGETIGEAAAASGGAGLTPIQQAMLGFGERIAASPTASTAARRLGTAIARTGIETPVKAAASILIPGLGAGAAGGLLAGLSGEEGENVAAAIGSGIAFGGIEGGIRLAKASSAKGFDNARVRQAVVEDLNTRPNDVQFTYVDPVAGDQTVTIKDRDARAEFYNKLKGEQLPKALSEIANAENAGVEVLFHKSGDPIPQGIQQIKYKGVALKPADVRGGRPTILINVDAASPETIPHELLHARLTDDIVRRAGANVVQDSFDAQTGKITQQGQQFQDFANSYATAIEKAGDPTGAARFRQELATGFDNTLQRPQRIEALKRLSDEMMAYYAQEFLAGKDPKTILPGRIPSFWKNAFDLAKNAVADRFSQRALQAGFDPVARTFYDANGKRIKIPWMEDAINQLIVKGEGFTPREQKVDLRGLTPAARNAVIADRGYADLFMLNPDGSFGRPLTAREVQINDARIAQSTIKLLDSLPQADRASVTGLDAKGNTIIEGRLSIKEAEALANSGIFSTSTSQFIKDIANAILNGDLLNSRYWKVYGKTGRAGVFPEVEKAILPYGISINSKGGVNVKVVDWTKVQSRMDKALKKSAYRNLFRSQDQAMSALLDVYLKNIAEKNAVPSAEALGGGADGARKRNFFNEVMGAVPKVGDVLINQPTAGYTASRKGGSVYEDLRIERVQDIEQTGIKVPWSGDMGEQSSYRRTQLNFQPAEQVGDTSVQTDQKAGYRILSKNNKFRVYSPSGELAGIFDTEGQAKLKAEKLYATETRLQPEIDQLQRPARNEVGQTPEAGGRNRIERRTQGSQEGGQVNQQVRQAGDVTTGGASPETGPRFMPSDTDYLAAVQAGDTQAAQQMVDQAAKAAGYTIKAYHGTTHGGFTEFNVPIENDPEYPVRGIFFSTDKTVPEQFTKRSAYDKETGKSPMVYNAYLKLEKPLVYRERLSSLSEAERKNVAEINKDDLESLEYYIEDNPNDTVADYLYQGGASTAEHLDGSAINYNYDGIIDSSVVIALDPSQIKSADPITRDNSGNVIPLSQRFQTSSADIRYMPQPDPSVPGAYSVTGGFRILPGKTGGRLRVYGPAGALVGIAGSLDEAQRMIRKKTKTN